MRGSLVLVVIVGILNSCGYTGGFLRDSVTMHQMNYNMNFQFVQFVRTVKGQAYGGAVFCVIPVGDDLYSSAMEDLYLNVGKMAPNQMIINLREDVRHRVFAGFYCDKRVTVSGDLVQFSAP
ncbi:MAG: hypothetical protein FJ109_21310 [Deltaproteobacteria bacterium]|nr:hypothetical protein [Deltaproteobacteria bacterium]